MPLLYSGPQDNSGRRMCLFKCAPASSLNSRKENVIMDLDIIVYGAVTLRQCLYGLGGIFTVYLGGKLIKKIFFHKSAPMPHSIAFTCSNCAWQGRVGQFASKCPKCGSPVR